MKKNVSLLSLLSALLLFSACQKEFSFETNSTPSSGSLQAEVSGDCLPKTVQGIYEVGAVLDADANYIDVQVNITAVGSYRIYSDTVNGIFFQAKGEFATAGLNTVRLTGDGTPLSAGIHNFTITYDSSQCKVAVSTLPQGSVDPAEFTLSGGPNTCLDYNLSGVYIKDVQLNAANIVDIKVNVTAIGTYSISTGAAINGITFSGTGALTALGEQTITLTGSGTPAVAMSTNMVVEKVTANCGFTVNVTEGAVYTIDCASAVVNGVYEARKELDATNTVDLTVNVATPGLYSITAGENGMTFSGSGSFTTAGPGQTITLTGTGTPEANGDFDMQIAVACAFQVTVDPAIIGTGGTWKFTSGATTYEGNTFDAEVVTDNNITYLVVTGLSNSATGAIGLTMGVNGGSAITTGLYSGSVITGKFAGFTYSGSAVWIAGAGTGASVNITLTTYNTTTGLVEGTFSGNAKDVSGAIVPITGGTFKAYLP